MGAIAILIPAAGASSRMRGTDKLTQLIAGEPLLRRQARRACAVGAHVVVTLPDHLHPRARALAGLPVQPVAIPDAEEGMAASLRRAVGMMPRGFDGVMILPADMPEIDEADMQALVDSFYRSPHPMVQQGMAEDGTPGHPVLFPADCIPALRGLTGDAGARDVLRANSHRLRRIPMPGRHAVTDLDTPEAWESWRRETGEPCAAE